ncbi:unnamed protein product [Rotaria sordida]|uniref:Uncharacterized protein n=2 Tax=Rotaria sordida TaxID=392033 RepID=A0A814ZYE2_9BILA|nr:unnamed protein product [Rotaria sordida]CAF1529207.1 unnamed protein product [Rotaria sordida]
MTDETNMDHQLAIKIGELSMGMKTTFTTELAKQLGIIRLDQDRIDNEELATLQRIAEQKAQEAKTAAEKKLNELKRKRP